MDLRLGTGLLVEFRAVGNSISTESIYIQGMSGILTLAAGTQKGGAYLTDTRGKLTPELHFLSRCLSDSTGIMSPQRHGRTKC